MEEVRNVLHLYLSVMSLAERSLVRKCSETGGFGDIYRWVVNWSALFYETVFKSSFSFTAGTV